MPDSQANRAKIGEALAILGRALEPYVATKLAERYGSDWADQMERPLGFEHRLSRNGAVHWDSQLLINCMFKNWYLVFGNFLGHVEKGWLSEIKEYRNRFAHEHEFDLDDTSRALDTMARLLRAIGSEADAAVLDVTRRNLTDQSRTTELRTRADEKNKLPPLSWLRAELIEVGKCGAHIDYESLRRRSPIRFNMQYLWKMLDQLAEQNHTNGEPLLSVLVVNKTSRLPGQGFFIIAGALGLTTSSDLPKSEKQSFVSRETARVYDHPWD